MTPGEMVSRHPVEDDHSRIHGALRDWWGGLGGEAGAQQRTALVPRLFLQHFCDTSWLVDMPDGELGGFLIGFMSQSTPGVAYIHFVGVNPAARRAGLGARLYQTFFDEARHRDAHAVMSITSPANEISLAFHRRLGFGLKASGVELDGLPVHRDYDGPGLDRLVFVRSLDQ